MPEQQRGADAGAAKLELRHRPVRDRGMQRFQAILAAGRAVLAEYGMERFTMEDVAVRADVPVGSVYQYFPNKFALVAEMAEQDTDALVAALAEESDVFPAEDWQARLDELLAHMAAVWAADPWRPAVFAAMRSSAATRQRAAEHSARLAQAVTVPLRPLTPSFTAEQRYQVALVLVETIQPLLNLTVRTGSVDQATLAELQRLGRAYLRAVALGG